MLTPCIFSLLSLSFNALDTVYYNMELDWNKMYINEKLYVNTSDQLESTFSLHSPTVVECIIHLDSKLESTDNLETPFLSDVTLEKAGVNTTHIFAQQHRSHRINNVSALQNCSCNVL